jgi:hypothetical protein
MAFGKARDKELLSAKREVAAILFTGYAVDSTCHKV